MNYHKSLLLLLPKLITAVVTYTNLHLKSPLNQKKQNVLNRKIMYWKYLSFENRKTM